MTRADVAADDTAEIWPDNWDSVTVFADLATQWRVGLAGPTGLDYGVIPGVLRLRRIPRASWAQVFDDVRVMELEALTAMGEK